MLPSKGYFRGVICPNQSRGDCQRPYCHFRHESRPETDSTSQTSSSAIVNENAEVLSKSSNSPSNKNVDEVSASSNSCDLVSSSSAVVKVSSNVPVNQVKNQASAMAIQPDLIQQLVNAAVQKVIADNPALAAGTVDTAAIMKSIDTSAIVAQATQNMSLVRTSTEQSANDEESTNTDSVSKSKRKFYLRPPNAPAYNPTPIKELEKRKLVIEDGDSYSPTPTSVRNRLLDDVVESESNSKGSGVESEATDFSSSGEDEEDKEKTKSEFDLLEEVLAEHSANNKTKVKKKKKKALGKLQYNISPPKHVDESSLISDARETCENYIADNINKTPNRKSKLLEVKEKTDQIEPAPYFLPPSPVFTGNSSCDGYNNYGKDYTDPYTSNSTFKEYGSVSSENEETIENLVINESFNEDGNIDCADISNDMLPISDQLPIQSEEETEPRKGHALLCQLVQNPIPVKKLSRQNISAWIPGAKKSTSEVDNNSATGDLLEAMVSNFDGGISQMPVTSKEKKDSQLSLKDNDSMPSKLIDLKSSKVNLRQEIQNLNSPQESNMLDEKEKEYLPKDVDNKSNHRAKKLKDNESKNTTSEDNSKKTRYQEISAESTTKKHEKEYNDFPKSESDKENNENDDKEIKSDENENKNGRNKKNQIKKKHGSLSDSEIDDGSDASTGKEKKNHKKKKKRSHKKSDSEVENSEESSDRDQKKKRKRKQKKMRKSFETDESDENTDKENTDEKCKLKSVEGKKDKEKKIKEKDFNSHSDSEKEGINKDKLDEDSDASRGKEKKKHKKKKRRSRKKSDSEEQNSDEDISDRDHDKKRKQKKKKKIESEESEVNTDKENVDKKHKSKFVEGKKDRNKINKEKDSKSNSDSEKEDIDKDKSEEESDASRGKGKKRYKKKKRRNRKKSNSEEENSDKELSDRDQDKKKKKHKDRKYLESEESEVNTDTENTDKKYKSKSTEGKKDKDRIINEKDTSSHSEHEKEEIDKDKLENKTKSNKTQEKVSERMSRSSDRKSENCHANEKKTEARDRSEEKDKVEVNERHKKKRKRSSSSERSSSRHRSSSRKHKKKRRGSKHKKKRGRKHKKRKYSRSDSGESDDDYSDEEEKSEESEDSEEKENSSKEKNKRHTTSKHHKRSSRNKKKSKHKRNKSSSESSSRSRSRSRSHSKDREKKKKDKKESQSKEEKKNSTQKSIPMPVDPSMIKEEKIDFVDLTKVKIEKVDDKPTNANRDKIEKSTENMQLTCTKSMNEKENADNSRNRKEISKQKDRINKSNEIKSLLNEDHKLSETKSRDLSDPIINKTVDNKEDRSSNDKERRKSVDTRRDSGDRSKGKDKEMEKSYSKSNYNDKIESNNSIDKVIIENVVRSSSSIKHKVDLDKEIEKLNSKPSSIDKERRKSVDARRNSDERLKEKEKDMEKSHQKSKHSVRNESNNSKDRVVKEKDSSSSNIHKVDLDKEIEKINSNSSISENLSSNIVGSNKNSDGSDKPIPTLSIFDMVLASTGATPTKKVLKEVSMFDAVAASNEDFPSPPPSPDSSPGHIPDSPSFDYNSKFTDPPGTFNFDGIKRRKSSSDEKDSSKEKIKDKDNSKLKDGTKGNRKEESNKESKKSTKENSKDTHSKEKDRPSKSKDDNHSMHRNSSSSSNKSSKGESKQSSSRSSTSKHKDSSSSRSSSHSKKSDDSKNHNSNSKHKSEKETDSKSNRHSSSSSHSNKKHSNSSSSKTSSSSSKKYSSSSSSSTKRKEMLFDDLLNKPAKKLKTEKIKSKGESGFTKNLDCDDGGDSPMPDLSALDEIEDDDWNQIINADKSKKYDDYSHLENLKSDDSDEDALADLDDPRVMEECKQMFDDFKPPTEKNIHQSAPKERKVSTESLKAQVPTSKQRIARAPSSGSSSGNLIQKPIHRRPKMTPTQMMMERYKKLKEKAEELNKLVKTQEKQLKQQSGKYNPADSSTKLESKKVGLSSEILNKAPGKTRISHVPNVAGLLQARDKMKSVPPPSSHLLLSSQASKASGSVPSHTMAMTNVKGIKRVAHTPAPETFARPIVPVEFGSKVPQNVRQRYLNSFIDECLKFCDGQAEAFSKAMAEERVCFNRATSRSIYLNLAVNTIKRLRMKQISEDAQELLLNDPQYSQDCFENQPSTSAGVSSKSKLSHPPTHKSNPMSHPTNPNLRSQNHFATIAAGGTKGSWSIEKVRRSNSEVEKLRGLPLYKHLKKYLLSEEDLSENGYARPDPEEKGKAVINKYDQRKKISPSATERHCDRCNVLYTVDKWGFPTSTLPCSHHWGRMYKRRAPGGLASLYSCCSGDGSTEGCNIASTHVSGNFRPKELRGYVRTLPKSAKNGDYGIFALDCEMCYTTAGNELTRLTIIDSDDNMVYDTLVKPDNPIIDYNTRFSGITEEDMEDVTTTIREVQTSCLTRFSDKTILIGHSLESDLHALKIIHDTVVDTGVVFPHKMGPPYKRALRNLSSEYLKRIIQQDVSGHDSKEDAAAAMDLMHWKIKEDLKVNK